MLITKREDATKQGFRNYSKENYVFGEVISTYSIFLAGGSEKGVWGEGGRLFEFEWEGEVVGWGWTLINFFCL